ncbi:MAG: thiamine-monophosphate kinase [Planctomycetes bacterium]|nr:thiamine-monophosphate kinase [Planctomycetota bacterium]
MAFQEFKWISELKTQPHPLLSLGIGDDCALFGGVDQWSVSTDSMVEGTHFLARDDPFQVGRKLVNVNLSDMAAMGCQPDFFLLNVHVPEDYPNENLYLLKEGMQEALTRFSCSLIGGDTVTFKKGPLSLVGTVIGHPFKEAAILRSGAKTNQLIAVTGALGGSYPTRHMSFEPRLQWSKALCQAGVPQAMMDISDGLLQDLGHILDASGVGADIDLDNVPIHSDVPSGSNALKAALSDGEDFELLFTLDKSDIENIPNAIDYTVIGVITPESGVLRGRDHSKCPFKLLSRLGYSHDQS